MTCSLHHGRCATARVTLAAFASATILLLLLVVREAAADVPPAQKQALVDLYSATNGPMWCDRWDLSTDPCTGAWKGIDCDAKNTTVLAVTREDEGMSGTIPASVGNLPDLTAFLLNGALSGTIPLTIGVWTNLQILQLGGNALSGSIPDVFGNMNQLYLLDLSGNRLIGNIPASLGACAMLQTLILSSNRLTGSIPKALTALPIDTFVASGNALSGTIPSGFRAHQFDVSFNQLSGALPEYDFAPNKPRYIMTFHNNSLTSDSAAFFRMLEMCLFTSLDLSDTGIPTSSRLVQGCLRYAATCRAGNKGFGGLCVA